MSAAAARPTAAAIKAAIKALFPAPEFAVAFEVAAGTGMQAGRHLDAVVMDLWPSRGLSLHGIEVKVSRGDWRREKRDPAKAEEIARFCDHFSVAAPPGVVPEAELPLAWGLLSFEGGRLKRAKAPARTETAAVGRPFLAAMLRAATRAPDGETLDGLLAKRLESLRAAHRAELERAVSAAEARGRVGAARWHELLAALGPAGLRGGDWLSDQAVIAAVKMVWAAGIAEDYRGLAILQRDLADMEARLRQALADFGLAEKAPAPRKGAG